MEEIPSFLGALVFERAIVFESPLVSPFLNNVPADWKPIQFP